MRIVQQIDNAASFFTLHKVFDRHAVLQIIHKSHVFLQKAANIKISELIFRLCNRLNRHIRIDSAQAGSQHIIQQRAGIIAPVDIRRVDMLIAHLFKDSDNRLFKSIFGENGERHGKAPS